MKKMILMLGILFICGVVSADICIDELKNGNVLLDIGVYTKYANANLAFKDVFWNVLYERLKLIGLLIVLCFTPFREKISLLLSCVFSFIWGFFFMSSISELGLAGVIVGLTSVLPHGLFYIGVFFMIIQKRNYNSFYSKNKLVHKVSSYIFMIILFLTGCVVESIVATHFIPWVIRLSLI